MCSVKFKTAACWQKSRHRQLLVHIVADAESMTLALNGASEWYDAVVLPVMGWLTSGPFSCSQGVVIGSIVYILSCAVGHKRKRRVQGFDDVWPKHNVHSFTPLLIKLVLMMCLKHHTVVSLLRFGIV